MQRVDAAVTPDLVDFLITTGHSLIGMTVLVLMFWRIRLRFSNPTPDVNDQRSQALTALARVWHLGLYGLVVFMAGSGVVSYYTEIEAAGRLHELGKWVLGMLVIGHILAGLVHWLIFKDQVLQGMLGKRRDADIIRGSDQSPDEIDR